MPPAHDPRQIAHDSLSLREPAFLKHYRGGAFKEWQGVSFWSNELPGPGFNFASALRLLDIISLGLEGVFQNVGNPRIIFDDENLHGLTISLPRISRCL